MASSSSAAPPTKSSVVQQLKDIGTSPLPPALLATLATALHVRPLQRLPLLFPPVWLFTTYLNLQGFKTDAAGLGAAWSATYLVLAARRSPVNGLRGKFSARGAVRGVTMALAGVEVLGGGLAYAFGKRERETPLLAGKKEGEGR